VETPSLAQKSKLFFLQRFLPPYALGRFWGGGHQATAGPDPVLDVMVTGKGIRQWVAAYMIYGIGNGIIDSVRSRLNRTHRFGRI
jgi:hypothetical protein